MLSSKAELQHLLEIVVGDLSLTVSPSQLQQLTTHFSLLLKWNAKINLTSIRDPQEIATRHFEESLFLTKLVPRPLGTMVDIGSGAGFPGLPLKIAWPGVATVLLEPNQKKTTFLKEVVRSCDLKGVDVRAERLESVAQGELAGRASLVTMRAVAPTRRALGDAVKLLSPGGHLALYTSAEEAQPLPAPGHFQWRQRAAIPHSLRRVVLIGQLAGD